MRYLLSGKSLPTYRAGKWLLLCVNMHVSSGARGVRILVGKIGIPFRYLKDVFACFETRHQAFLGTSEQLKEEVQVRTAAYYSKSC
jgi:hypothetical protein